MLGRYTSEAPGTSLYAENERTVVPLVYSMWVTDLGLVTALPKSFWR
jgi:hypothetical protein